MNKTCRPFNNEEFELVIMTLKNGYKDENNVVHRSNPQVAFAIWLEGVLGLRVSDVCRLTLSNFIKKNERDYYIRIKEKKTGKIKELYCPTSIYDQITNYCLDNNINRKNTIIKIGERAIQKQLKNVSDYLGLEGIGTHSSRKRFATNIYEQSDYDLLLLQSILLHSSIETTKRYVRVNTTKQKEILQSNVVNF